MLYPLSYGGVIRTSLERVTTRRGATTLTAREVSLKSRAARTGGVEAVRRRSVSGISIHPNKLK